MKWFFVLWSCAVSASARRPSAGDPLQYPDFVSSQNGVLDTTLTIRYNNYIGAAHTMMNARLLNGTLPGPTLRLHPGDTLRIHFINRLVSQPDAVRRYPNHFQAPDESNLHFHGLHVSGELPSDDVRLRVAPGDSYQYHTVLPHNHMPGTHWIHPHVHGSSSLQVGGGAGLALIVQDPPQYLPSTVEAASEQLLVVQHFDLTFLADIARESGDDLLRIYGGTDESLYGLDEFRLVNGQYQPTLQMRPGEWQRWRVVYAGWLYDPLQFRFRSNRECDMQLLAKDGVYIRDFPRQIDFAPIPAGGRADIMVRCHKEGEHAVLDFDDQVILRVQVSGETVASQDLEPWTPEYPDYLRDLRNEEPSEGCSCFTKLGGNCHVSESDDAFCMNRLPFDPNLFIHQVYLGAVVERRLINVDGHPYHQHVYPYQIISELDEDDEISEAQKNYFRRGDWHDVLMIEDMELDAVVRYHPTVHTGRIMLHCHRLNHEDQGMMAQENVVSVNVFGGGCQCNTGYFSPDPNPLIQGPARTSTPTRPPTKTSTKAPTRSPVLISFHNKGNDDGDKTEIFSGSIPGDRESTEDRSAVAKKTPRMPLLGTMVLLLFPTWH